MAENALAALAPPADEATGLAGLFRGSGKALFDRRAESLASGQPADWQAVDFPIELAVELAAACNLKCVMCPVPTTSRPPTLMEDALFRQVADQLAGRSGFVLLPQGFGESFLHPRWSELLAHARARGVAPIVLLTNGMLLHEKNIERLLGLGLDALLVSIDGVNPDTYRRLRVGGDLEVVERNVARLLEKRSGTTPKLVVRIIRMRETAAEVEAFFARWRPRLGPGDEIHVAEFHDWAGKVGDHAASPARGAPRAPCRMLWKNLSIHADGKVSACCHDSEDELIVGDASRQSVEQIWNGPELARLRALHLAGRIDEIPICRGCTSWI